MLQTKIPTLRFRPDEKKPYVYQPYPSHRFHPDGREMVVRDEADEMERCPASEGWTSKAPPPKPAAPPERPMSFADLKAELEKRTAAFNMAWKELTGERAKLEKECDGLRAFAAEKVAEIQGLHGQLTRAKERILSLAPSPETPDDAPKPFTRNIQRKKGSPPAPSAATDTEAPE